MSTIYCKRCDLAFCEAHRDSHPDEYHEIVEDHRFDPVPCAVCMGIYLPKAPS